MNGSKIFRILIIILLFLISISISTYAEERKNVLILNSYHQGYKWTDDETKGIITGLFPESENIKLYIEYMGTKWNLDSSYFAQLTDLYKKKFGNTRFDVIISSDDDAFNFLKLNKDAVFGKIPVVFTGINWITSEKLQGLKLYTGVNEDADIPLNIDLVLRLHPGTKSLYIITDTTTTGYAILHKLFELVPQYENKVKIILLYNIEMPVLLSKLSTLETGSLVLLTVFQRDKTGRFFEYSDSCSMISKNSKVPVYGLWDFNLGSGIVGGNLASGYGQGLTAGKLALRVLRGEPVDSIPVVMNSPNLYMFDFKQLKRFNIDTSLLPDGSTIINEPSSFYSINKQLFNAILIAFLILTGVIIVLILNIRKRYLAEKAFTESEEKYHILVDNLNVGVFRTSGDLYGRFIQVNPAMVKIFGYDSIDDFIKLPVTSLYQDTAERKVFIDDLVNNGAVVNKELPMKKKDGTPILASVSATAQFHESGDRVIWIDGILEDVTEKKKMEMDLRRAQKMETIGTLTSGIAHDFNNAMGGLIGVLSILDHKLSSGLTVPDDKLRQYITIMKESGEKAVTMVQRLLTLSRKRDAELVPADINELLKRVVELLSGAIDKSVSIFTKYVKEKAVILADPVQIEQALLNLCLNAGHAMTIMKEDKKTWGGVLSISIEKFRAEKFFLDHHPEAEEKEYWIISIADTGIGMKKEVLAKIFEPFFTTKGEGVGTGLGLTMVNSIVKEHGGFVDVYSEPGIGTTLKLYIPVSYEKHEIAAAAVTAEIPMGSGLILVVDDEPVMRKTAREILEECGYSVITAENGASGVVIYREMKNDITAVVMDMSMPVMSGIVAYREMKLINPGVRVLISSGFRQDKRVGEALLMGVAGFIEKPYTLEKLGNAVKEIIVKKI